MFKKEVGRIRICARSDYYLLKVTLPAIGKNSLEGVSGERGKSC